MSGITTFQLIPPLRVLPPQERFFSDQECIRRLPAGRIETNFLMELERRVSADSVVTIGNVEYEVDMRFVRQRIRLRCSPGMENVYVAEPDDTLFLVRLLNKQENASVKREKILLSERGEGGWTVHALVWNSTHS